MKELILSISQSSEADCKEIIQVITLAMSYEFLLGFLFLLFGYINSKIKVSLTFFVRFQPRSAS